MFPTSYGSAADDDKSLKPKLSGTQGPSNFDALAALLRDTQGASPRLTFQQAQNRMKNYLVAGYKMTPLNPTLLEARDAVLAAAFTNDPVDGARFAQAFAKRGAGTNAVAPDRFSTTNVGVVEDYTVASN